MAMGLREVGWAADGDAGARAFHHLVSALELAAETGDQALLVWQPGWRRVWFSPILLAALWAEGEPAWTGIDDFLATIEANERPQAEGLLRLCMAGQRSGWTQAFTLRRADGSRAKLECRMNSRGDGLFVGAVLLAESELTEARTLLRLLSDELNDGSWEWDIAADRVTLSPRLCGMLGLPAQALVTNSAGLADLVHPEDRPTMAEVAGQALNGIVDGFRNRLRFRHADGGYRHILCAGRRLPYAGPPRFVGRHLDITEAVERERQMQALAVDLRHQTALALAASRAKSAFLSSVSHEFRTPLSSILGFAELLHGAAESDLAREYADYVRQAGYRLMSYVDALLAFVRYEGDAPAARAEMVDTVKAVRAVARSTQGSGAVPMRAVGPVPAVRADPQALHAGLSAMLSAMHDLTGQRGGLDMVVRATDCGGRVRLRVRATGEALADAVPPGGMIGFPESQTDIPADRQAVGLKFLVARKVAERFGGTCALRARSGVGLIAEMSLPTIKAI
jgi:PAS domain S-box-containing protein